MKQAEARIEEDAIAAEVDEMLGGEEAEAERKLAALSAPAAGVAAEAALAELKARLEADKVARSRALPAGATPPDGDKKPAG
jgi:hypothetical protein